MTRDTRWERVRKLEDSLRDLPGAFPPDEVADTLESETLAMRHQLLSQDSIFVRQRTTGLRVTLKQEGRTTHFSK